VYEIDVVLPYISTSFGALHTAPFAKKPKEHSSGFLAIGCVMLSLAARPHVAAVTATNYACKSVVRYRGVSGEKVVVFYKHSRRQGVQRQFNCVDATTVAVMRVGRITRGGR